MFTPMSFVDLRILVSFLEVVLPLFKLKSYSLLLFIFKSIGLFGCFNSNLSDLLLTNTGLFSLISSYLPSILNYINFID